MKFENYDAIKSGGFLAIPIEVTSGNSTRHPVVLISLETNKTFIVEFDDWYESENFLKFFKGED